MRVYVPPTCEMQHPLLQVCGSVRPEGDPRPRRTHPHLPVAGILVVPEALCPDGAGGRLQKGMLHNYL